MKLLKTQVRSFFLGITAILALSGITSKKLFAQELIDYSLMLTHKELAKRYYKTPYVVEIKSKEKQLTIVGSNHSNNPNDKLFLIIDSLFKQTNPQIAFNEGGEFKIYSTKDSTILNSWEPGYLIFLCQKKGVLRKSIEPPNDMEIEEILKVHSNEEVFLFYAYRNACQLKRQIRNKSKSQLELNFSKYLNKIGRITFDKSDEEVEYRMLFNSLYEKYFQNDFSFSEVNYDQISPFLYKSNLNQINREIANIRDKYMIREIYKQLEQYDRIFIVLGASHVVRQESVIRDFFD